MAVGGQYAIQLRVMIDTKGVLAQIAQIQKQAGKIMIGGAGVGKSAGGIAAVGKEATRTAAGVKKLNGAIDTTGKNIKKIEGRKLSNTYSNVGKGAKQATSNMKTFGSTTLDVTKKVIQFGAVTAAIRGVTTGMGAMVQQTFELDSALVEFKKVSNLSEEGLKRYTDQAYKAGEATAKTGVEMIDAATQFKKMGYDEQTSLQLAKHATMFQNIADAEISAGDAAKFINSQMKAYQGEFKSLGSEGEKAAKVIDTVNEVANKNAVGTNDLQLALTKTSAAMGGFGNSFDEVVGIMTAGTEIMVGMPSQVARGWRTIGANILQIAQSSDQYVAASGKVKIATRDQNGEMKNTYAMMKDLYEGIDGVSVKWNDLSKEEQSAIALQLGGKNNMEKFRAVMDNFGTAIKATTEAQESQGSATKENARYLDSLEGKLQAVKSAWSRFSNAMVKSDTVKTALSGLASVLNLLASDAGQAMIKAGLAIGAFAGAVKILNAIRGATVFASLISGAGNFAREMGISTKALGKFKRALGGMSSASLLGLASIAGVIAVGMYKAYKQTHKYRNEVKALSKANEENIEAIDENAKSAEFYADKIEELSKVEDKTNAEKERMAAYVKKLNELMPGLNLEYDKEKDALNKTTDAVREYIKAKQEEAKIKAYQENFEKSLNEQVKLEEKRKDALKEMERAQKQYDDALDAAGNTGVVDPQILKNYNGAKSALKDITEAYIESSKEVAKQNNNMLVASGDWNTMANKAKTAGWEITKSLQDGLDSGTYLIPETMGQLESLISFDDVANKLSTSNVGKSLVEALQQGMREGDIDIDNALRIADQMKDLQSVMTKEGKASVEELANQFSRGEIDFTTLQNGINNALSGVESFDLLPLQKSMSDAGKSAGEVADRIREISETNPEAKISVGGIEIAEEHVDTVLDYLDKVDGEDSEATINVDGSEVAVSDIENVEELLSMINGKEYDTTIDADIKGEKDVEKFTDKVEKTPDKKDVKVKAKVDGDEEVKNLTEDVEKTPNKKNVKVKAKVDGDGDVKDLAEDVEKAPKKKDIKVKATGEVDESVEDVTSVTSAPPIINRTVAVGGVDLGAGALLQSINAEKIPPKSLLVKGKTDGSFTGAKSKYEGVPKSRSVILTVGGKIAATFTNALKKLKAAKDKFATGTRNAPEGLAEVNEQGWEFIRDAKTGQLRVAGGGSRTVTYLGKGDTVYTHAESKRMVAEGEKDIKIPQHAKGKKSKKKAQKKYNKKYNKRKKSYENAIEDAEYKAEMEHWSDKELEDEKRRVYNAHIAALKKWNKSKAVKKLKKRGAKVKNSFGKDAYREIMTGSEGAAHDLLLKDIEKSMSNFGRGLTTDASGKTVRDNEISANDVAEREDYLKTLRDKKKISAEEYEDYLEEIRKAYLDNQMELYRIDNVSYSDMLKNLDDYVKAGKITWEDYYDYIGDLMDEQLDKETKRLEKLQKKNSDTYDLAKSWIDRKIEQLEKENEQMEEQNELIEKQNELEKARSQRVKVYRQGRGFVYEQDTQAIKEATTALKDYKKEVEKSPELQAWEKIRDLFDQAEVDAEIRNFEVLVGDTFDNLFGKYGTNEQDWLPWIKENLATRYGYENLLEDMGELNGWQAIQDFLSAEGAVEESKILEYITNNRFASGSLATPAGFTRVGEQGYEIALLGKGDSVMPHEVSENLMAWGAHSPIEYASAMANTTSNSYHFDRLVLPNVTDANSLLNELNNLPNKALQYSRSRA